MALRKCLEIIRQREGTQYVPINIYDFFGKALEEKESINKLEKRRQEKAELKKQRKE